MMCALLSAIGFHLLSTCDWLRVCCYDHWCTDDYI